MGWKLSLALGVAMALLAGPALAEDDICRPAGEAALQAVGIERAGLRKTVWVVETRIGSPGHEVASGYRLYAVPEACAQGDIVVQMDVDCRVTSIRSRRGCEAQSLQNHR